MTTGKLWCPRSICARPGAPAGQQPRPHDRFALLPPWRRV